MAAPRSLLLLPVAAAVLACAGCGSDDASPTTSSAAAPATPAATAPTTSAPAAAPATPASSAKRVSIKDFDYAPGTVEVAVGTKVTWTNRDAANHTVTFDSGDKQDLGNQPTGKSVTRTFTKPGTYAYHCDFHTNMHGTVVVR